ncbi:MAG: aminotransferase class III-fold pyridoxal phosphate-dependent enzyme, partial [Bacteroidetes bacterium]|nr:aminotransferase class III-fold pyridoxal phosphate-dependent enzyme [Bacteroidota bacterium]
RWISNKNILFTNTLLQKKNNTIKNIRVLGTIVAFEINNGNDEYLNNISATITQKAMQMGVYIRPLGNTVYIMPPYCITENELEKIYEVILNIIK